MSFNSGVEVQNRFSRDAILELLSEQFSYLDLQAALILVTKF